MIPVIHAPEISGPGSSRFEDVSILIRDPEQDPNGAN